MTVSNVITNAVVPYPLWSLELPVLLGGVPTNGVSDPDRTFFLSPKPDRPNYRIRSGKKSGSRSMKKRPKTVSTSTGKQKNYIIISPLKSQHYLFWSDSSKT